MSLLRRSKASAAPRKTPKPRGCRVCAGCGEAYPGYYIVARDGAGEDVCYECWTDCVVTSWAGAYLSDRYEHVPKVHRIYFPLPVESRQPDAGAGLRSIGNGIRAQRKPFDLLTEDAAEIGRKELRPFAVIRALAGRTVYVNYRAGKARRRRPTRIERTYLGSFAASPGQTCPACGNPADTRLALCSDCYAKQRK